MAKPILDTFRFRSRPMAQELLRVRALNDRTAPERGARAAVAAIG